MRLVLSTPKISVGLGTLVGYGSALAFAVAGVIENDGALQGPGKWALIVAAAKAALTTLGRQGQAGAAVLRASGVSELPSLDEELAGAPPSGEGPEVAALPAPAPEIPAAAVESVAEDPPLAAPAA